MKKARMLANGGLIAAVVAAGAIPATPAQADTLTPVVDLCTGISLDRSLVTEVIGDVNQPLLTDIEGAINGLLGIPLLGQIANFSLDLTGALDNAAMGAPISLQVLNSDGVIVGPGDCNIAGDGFTLNTEGGIAIGGNAITGLGAEDRPATAGTIDAIAFGNDAATAADAGAAIAVGTGASVGAGATGGVALGNSASVTAANSVALGAGSVADRGAQTGYSAPGLSGTFDSAGSVSVGSAGNLRQITNLAPGTAPSDAATVGQVQGALDAVADLDVRVTTNEGDIANLDGRVTTNETNIANLDTRVTTNETDIANLDVRVTANEGDIANLDNRVTVNEGDIANLDGRVTTNETIITNLDGRVTTNETDIANLDTRVTVNEGDIANIDARVTVAEGDIVALDNSLTQIDARVTANETTLVNIQAQVGNVPVRYVSDADGTTPSATPTNTAALIGANPAGVTLTNVAAGELSATSSDAVNGAQLFATNQAVSANAAAIAANSVAIGQNRTDIDANTAAITTINNNIAGSTVVAVQYSNPSTPTQSNGGTVTNDVTLVGADSGAPVALHNVADALYATDAVNLRQLQGSMDTVLSSANSYTDMRFAEARAYTDAAVADIRYDLAELQDEASAGTAGALAMSSLPQVMDGGTRMLAGSFGHYRGETAFAIGLSAALSEGNGVMRMNGSIDTQGYAGVSLGAGFSF